MVTSQGLTINWGDLFERRDVHSQVVQEAIAQAVDPAMDLHLLPARPRVLDDRGVADIIGLLDDVKLAEGVQLRGAEDALHGHDMLMMDIANVTQPIIDEAQLAALQGSLDAATTIVPTDDDVFDLQDIDGVLQHGEAVQVGVNDEVSDVTVHEELSRKESDNFIRGHTAVRTTNPEELRALLLREGLKKLGPLPANVL